MPENPKIFITRLVYNYLFSKKIVISPSASIVSFTFDDFPETAFFSGGHLLNKYDLSGTFYLAPGLLGQDTEVGKIISIDEMPLCFESPHEIGHHSFSHLKCSEATPDKIISDIKEADIFFRNIQYKIPSNFSFPFGEDSLQAQKILRNRFDTCRGIYAGINRGKTNLLNLKANAIYTKNNNLELLIKKIEDVQTNGGWLIFYTHDISPHPSPYGCTPYELELLINTSLNSNLTVKNIKNSLREILES